MRGITDGQHRHQLTAPNLGAKALPHEIEDGFGNDVRRIDAVSGETRGVREQDQILRRASDEPEGFQSFRRGNRREGQQY